MRLVATTLPGYDESAEDYKHRTANDHYIAWHEKPLHGHFLRQVSDLICSKTQWLWLKFGKFTKELEGLIFAAQEQALSTNVMESRIYRHLIVVCVVYQMRLLTTLPAVAHF